MKKLFLSAVVIILIIWSIWSYTGRSHTATSIELALDIKEAVMADSTCQKNIVGIQPYMFTTDYLSEKHFYEKIKGYFEHAKQAGYFTSNTVVLLPEYLGTWLAIANEKASVAESTTLQNGMAIIVASNPVKVIRNLYLHHNEPDRFAAAIFRMKAEEMATIYATTFKKLAKDYNVTIIAGSTVLPGPTVENNEIKTDASQPLYNASFIFGADGTIDSHVVKKSFPIKTELPFLHAATINELPVFSLPIGKTVVLICADSWYPQSYERIDQLEADVVLVPSYCTGDNAMTQKWKGYDGIERPADVDTTDIHQISEQAAWAKYALPGRMKQIKSPIGVNVFLRGELWDLGSDGQPFFISGKELLKTGAAARAGIWNFCF